MKEILKFFIFFILYVNLTSNFLRANEIITYGSQYINYDNINFEVAEGKSSDGYTVLSIEFIGLNILGEKYNNGKSQFLLASLKSKDKKRFDIGIYISYSDGRNTFENIQNSFPSKQKLLQNKNFKKVDEKNIRGFIGKNSDLNSKQFLSSLDEKQKLLTQYVIANSEYFIESAINNKQNNLSELSIKKWQKIKSNFMSNWIDEYKLNILKSLNDNSKLSLAINNELKIKNKKILEFLDQIDLLTTAINEIQDEKENLQSKIKNLKNKLQNKEQEISDLKKQNSSYLAKIDVLKRDPQEEREFNLFLKKKKDEKKRKIELEKKKKEEEKKKKEEERKKAEYEKLKKEEEEQRRLIQKQIEEKAKRLAKIKKEGGFSILGIKLSDKRYPPKCRPVENTWQNMLRGQWKMHSCQYQDKEDQVKIFFDKDENGNLSVIKIERITGFVLNFSGNNSASDLIEMVKRKYGEPTKSDSYFWYSEIEYKFSSMNETYSVQKHQCNPKNDTIKCPRNSFEAVKFILQVNNLTEIFDRMAKENSSSNRL